jgi:hypothetical protein
MQSRGDLYSGVHTPGNMCIDTDKEGKDMQQVLGYSLNLTFHKKKRSIMCMARPARLVQLKRDYMGDK